MKILNKIIESYDGDMKLYYTLSDKIKQATTDNNGNFDPNNTIITEDELYRGVGNNYASGTNKGFVWVSTDEDLASGYGDVENYEVDVDSLSILPFTYKNHNTKVQGSDLINGFVIPSIRDAYKSGKISDEELETVFEKSDVVLELMDETMEPFHTKINKPTVAKDLSELLKIIGFDAISIIENGVLTYGIIK